MAHEGLKGVRNFVAEQWWRFLIGIQLLTLLNFVLLVITASDKLKSYLGFAFTTELLAIFVPTALFGAWLLGFILERYIKFPQQQEREATKRSPTWQENFKRLDALGGKLEALGKRMEKIEKKLE